MDIEYSSSTIGTLQSLLLNDKKPVLLLGAGCSIKSGIPSASEFVDKAAKYGYARENGLPSKEVSIRRSDWYPWLIKQKWYKKDLSAADNYPYVVENLLQPKAIRREFLKDVLNPQVPPSSGYNKLADLIGLKVFQTILTTNFDSLIATSCNGNRAVHGYHLVKNYDEIIKISTNPDSAQIVHLHGDIETYTDKNLINEISSLHSKLVERLIPILRDNPIIVIGYRGAEDSIMKSLLLSQTKNTDGFPNGIYWCHYDKSSLDDIPSNVISLANEIKSNFQLIKTPGFDDLIHKIWYDYKHEIQQSIEVPAEKEFTPDINDLKIIKNENWNFDNTLLKKRIISYCKSLYVYYPENPSSEWIDKFGLERDLLKSIEGNLYPTFAGLLLFGENIDRNIPYANVELSIDKNEEWLSYIFDHEENDVEHEFEGNILFKGNLWEQLDGLLDILSQFNKSFRLKGEISRDVLPYPPLALKELLVNALVHRDYKSKEPTKIHINSEFIEISNPGGITEDLKKSLDSDSIFNKISKGRRGIKSYRNPVIADFFYGGGAMDKAGSGLADVYDKILEYNSKVLFGPDDSNENFKVQIFARPESIDSITQTATTDMEGSVFVGNMLEILQLPEFIYEGYVNELFNKKQFYAEHRGFIFPPFEMYGNDLIQFYPFDKSITPLADYVEPSMTEKIPFSEFEEKDEDRKMIVRLLNKSIQVHLESLGLIVDWRRQRAYFPKLNDTENRTVSYHARVKRATRTVAKRIINKKTDELLYWEHKSVNYQIKRFGSDWVLVLLPGYVFSVDGEKWLVKSEKISRLATKRSSIDYNKSVLNDLYFWSNIIAKGEENAFWIQFNPENFKQNISPIKISAQYPKLTTNRFQDFDSNEGYDYDDIENLEDEVSILIDEIKSNSINQRE
ncbi:hypothetical protein E0K83_07810 [Gramella sp. BOM4]|nr:hypothetical protein [Christiangramia bathymodioli]